MFKQYCSIGCALLLFTSGVAQISFQEKSADIGFENVTYGSGDLGGGISFFDYNQDGWDDLTVSSEEGSPTRFFKNESGVFVEEFFNIADDLFETKSVVWVDYDNDADYDLFVASNIDDNRLYKNNGNLVFEDVTISSGLATSGHKTYGGSWGDYNNDGYLDVYLSARNTIAPAAPDFLFKNNGDGTFTNVTNGSGLRLTGSPSFCSAFFDYNNDGLQDIYVAIDRPSYENLLYKNQGDGTFINYAIVSGCNAAIDAMSTTIGDFNNDGYQDIYVTNSAAGNAFYRNNGDETFTDIAVANGTVFNSIGWGAVFLDGDNDADKDLYVSGMLDGSNPSLLPSAFYENDGSGNYSIPSNAGFANDTGTSFANAIGDVNNDGLPDIAVLNYAPYNHFVFVNTNNDANNWLKVKLQGTESNWQGIGATIEISVDGEVQNNYTLLGEGYLAQNSSYEFFGLGSATNIDYIKVTWLSGIEDYIENPAINQHLTIVEGAHVLSTNNYETRNITVFPNPASSTITITVASQDVGKDILLYDLFGRVLEERKVTSLNEVVDVSLLSSGMYLISVEGGQQKFTASVVVD